MSSEHPFPWLFPITAMLAVFGIYPLFYAVWLSFHKKKPTGRGFDFAWFDTWSRALHDDRVWTSLYTTFFYTFTALAVQLVLGMLIALLLDSDRRGYGVLRGLMTLPLVVPPAIVGMMFLLLQDGSFGVLSFYLYQLGLVSPAFPVLAQPSTAIAAVLLADIWQWTPFMVLILLAGLRALPKDPYEAAAIDGATNTQMFFKITLPLMSKVIAVAVLIRGVDLFRIYDYVYVMTSGGPGTSTETLSFYAGRMFGAGDFPYASTLSLLMLIVILIVSNVVVSFFKVKF